MRRRSWLTCTMFGIASLLATALLVRGIDPPPAEAAGPRPLFQLPLACGETWRLDTYPGHGDYDVDMFPTVGSAWGRPILASFGGTVIAAGIDGTLGNRTPTNPTGPIGTGGGYYVKIDHGSGWHTLYLHMLEPPMVSTGHAVRTGQQIGKVGSTGQSSGPHLHYEQRRDGSKVETWFNGEPSGITTDGQPSGEPRTGPVYLRSANCGTSMDGRSVDVRGDVNGDGRSDLVTLYDYGNDQTKLLVGLSSGSTVSAPTPWWDSTPGTWTWSRNKLMIGDFTGDGRDDAAVFYQYPNLRTKMFVFVSTGTAFLWPQLWYDSGDNGWDWTVTIPAAGDYNGDGRTDLAAFYINHSTRTRLLVGTSTGTSVTTPTAWYDSGDNGWEWARTKPAVGDYNGDGRTDLGAFYDYGSLRTKLLIGTSTGTTINAPSAWYDSGINGWDWSRTLPAPGDYNDDGRTDLAAFYVNHSTRTRLLIGTSTGTTINTPTAWYDSDPYGWEGARTRPLAGDYNGDGRTDLAAVYDSGHLHARLLVGTTSGTSITTPTAWWNSQPGGWDLSRTTLA